MPDITPPKIPTIACSAGCKKEVVDPEKAGWEFLPISRRWRCGDCGRELRNVCPHKPGFIWPNES